MASVKQTMRHCLLNYPNIFPYPRKVADHWFAVNGNGMYWKDGELVEHPFGPEDQAILRTAYGLIKMDDIEEREQQIRDTLARFGQVICPEHTIANKYDRMTRAFVQEHINDLCDAPVTFTLGHAGPKNGHYVTEQIYIPGVMAFQFPDNIAADWAKALDEWLQDWLVRFNQIYGIYSENLTPELADEWFKRVWPENIYIARSYILHAQERLWPIRNNGETRTDGLKRLQELSNSLMASLTNDPE